MIIQPDLKIFKSRHKTKKPQLMWIKASGDLETPVSIMIRVASKKANSFLLESVQGGSQRGRYSAIGLDPDLIWKCQGSKAEINHNPSDKKSEFIKEKVSALNSLEAIIDESRIDIPENLPPMSSGLFGYIGYDMIRLMEKIPDKKKDSLNLPDGLLIRPKIMIIFDNVEDVVYIITPIWPKKSMGILSAYKAGEKRLINIVNSFEKRIVKEKSKKTKNYSPKPKSNTTKSQYFAMVKKAKKYIRDGDIFQVVPSQRFSIPFTKPPFNLYRSLRTLNPSPFLFFMNFGNFSIVGSSPEILVRLKDNQVTIRPIAGTRKRGSNKSEDRKLSEELLKDPKEISEHLMLLDLGRNDIGRVSKIGTVKVTHQMAVEYYSHVMHIVSNVVGQLKTKLKALDALIGGFPAGTVSGAPKIRAMEIIEELENSQRGVYAGAIGYFSCNGEMDTCIALRTAVIKNKTMYVQAGGGIVADSDPKKEYEETCNKAKALLFAAEQTTG